MENTTERLEKRNKEFLAAGDREAVKYASECFSVNLRKKKRNEFFCIKRAKYLEEVQTPPEIEHLIPLETEGLGKAIAIYIQLIKNFSSDTMIRSYCFYKCCLLFKDKKAVGVFIDSGLFDIVIESINIEDHSVLKYSTWLLINFSAGDTDHCLTLIEKGVIQACVWLIHKGVPSITEDSIWCLANLSANNKQASQKAIDLGVLNIAINIILQNLLKNLEKAYWLLAHICKEIDSDDAIHMLFSIFLNALDQSEETIKACLSGLFCLTINSEKRVDILLSFQQSVDKLIDLCHSQAKGIPMTAVKILSNIAATNDRHTQVLLDENILPCVFDLLLHYDFHVRKECFFLLSNLLASSQINQIVAYNNLINRMLDGTLDTLFDIRIEAWQCFNPITLCLLPSEIDLYPNLICYIAAALKRESDPTILAVIMAILENILSKPSEFIPALKQIIEETSCLDSIGAKRDHGNANIAELAEKIIKEYYDFDELHGIPPDPPEDNHFEFT